MTGTTHHYAALARAFHEPSRLQILAMLVSSPQGLSFSELKLKSDLTDGNLSRHLKTLVDAKAIRLEKAFINAKPRTTVSLTEQGRTEFLAYLDHLESVLRQAKAASKSGAADSNGLRKRTA